MTVHSFAPAQKRKIKIRSKSRKRIKSKRKSKIRTVGLEETWRRFPIQS
jgi:hypothetical protein